MHMSVLQEANVLLLCQSTSSAGAVGVQQTGRQHFRYMSGTGEILHLETDASYLNGRGTAVWLLLCGHPI